MKRLITCRQAQELDAATKDALGLDDIQLMEKASVRLWDALKSVIEGLVREGAINRDIRNVRILALCGKGNNGGDALAVLRHAFSFGVENLEAMLSADTPSATCERQRRSAVLAGIPVRKWDEVSGDAWREAAGRADIILDGVLGSGISGAASGEAARMIAALDSLVPCGTERPRRPPFVVSIDVPSGLFSSWQKEAPLVKADFTLAISPVKVDCYIPDARDRCGVIVDVADIFPEKFVRAEGAEFSESAKNAENAERAKNEPCTISLLEEADLPLLNPPLPASSYKMSRGRLAILAGSKGRLGAAILCARAALVSGAGYVSLFIDENLYEAAATALPSVIVRPEEEFWTEAADCDAVLAGPGWSQSDRRAEQLASLLRLEIPLVLDADALRLFARSGLMTSGRKSDLVLTPHLGEYAALREAGPASGPDAGDSGGLAASPGEASQGTDGTGFGNTLRNMAHATRATILVKSHVTWIASPTGKMAVWDGMTPAIGTAGSGDVLSGLAAGILACRTARRRRAESEDSASGSLQSARRGMGGPVVRNESGAAGAAPTDGLWGDKLAFDVSCCAVLAHGLAGRRLAEDFGWFGASDLIPACAGLLGRAGENAPFRGRG